jgi:hypothetical protein
MHLRSWDLSPSDWAERWNADWPPESLLLAERPDQVVLSNKADAPRPEGPPGRPGWSRGHLFTSDWHVQWRRLGGRVRVAAFGAPAPLEALPDSEATLDLAEAEQEERTVALWGAKQEGEDFWLELRIPHVMRAPHLHPDEEDPPQGAARRRLSVVVYRADDHRVLAQRLTGLRYAATGDDGADDGALADAS